MKRKLVDPERDGKSALAHKTNRSAVWMPVVACCELLLWLFSLAQWLQMLLLLQVGVDVHGMVAEYKNQEHAR